MDKKLKIRELKEKYSDYLIREGAFAVGEDEDGLVVFTKKRPPKQIKSFALDVSVKIIELDEPFKAYNRQGKVRPLQGGISIGHKDIGAGTLSIIVQDKNTKEPLILSNNHVLANANRGKKGDAIFQPGLADAADAGIVAEKVGELERFIPIANGVTVDCAVAKITKDWTTGLYGIYPEVRDEQEPIVGLNIQKSGRTTDTTYGTIQAVNVDVDVYYDTLIRLKKCFIAKLQGAPGDSGSLITTQGSKKKVVGILFAGSSGYIVGCRWDEVKNQLGIELTEDIRPVLLDVSHHNGKILDANQLKKNKVPAVYLKCCEGDYYKDTKFDENWDILKSAGIKVAPYIFVNPRVSAQKHFDFFKQCIGDKVPNLPVMLDCEATGDQSRETITSVIQTLAQLINQWQKFYTNLTPIIYTRASWWNVFVLPWSGWKDYGLWVARYGTDLPWFGQADIYKVRDWNEWLLWQYSADENNDGSRYGFESRAIDKNIMSQKFIEVYLNNQLPQPPPEENYKFYGRVLVDNLRIRKQPNINGQIIGYLSRNQKVGFLEIVQDGKDYWGKMGLDKYCAIVYNGNKFVELDTDLPQPKKRGKVLVNNLRIRSQPNVNASVVGYLYTGNEVEILEEISLQGQKWVKIGLDKYAAMVYNGNVYIRYI